MATTPPMERLYERLSGIGFAPDYVRDNVLPKWWDDDISQNPAGYMQAADVIATLLGLDLESVLDDSASLRHREVGRQCLKLRRGVAEAELAQAKCICTRAAELAHASMLTPFTGIPSSGAEIRQEILGTGVRHVDLQSLLQYCWGRGIPVVYVSELPPGAKKPDGVAARIEGRPVIGLCKVTPFSAWLVFILAHELGHIARGHVDEDGILADEDVTYNVADDQERAADAFAVELLTGDPNKQYDPAGDLKTGELAKYAQAIGSFEQVDPGVVALNYAKHKDRWGPGINALKILEPGAKATLTVHAEAFRRLRLDLLAEEERSFLQSITVGGQR